MKLLVLNGPNINLLGIREKAVYGSESYDALLALVQKAGSDCGVSVDTFRRITRAPLSTRSRRPMVFMTELSSTLPLIRTPASPSWTR